MSPHTPTQSRDQLLAKAREQMAWRPVYQNATPEQQAALVQQQARALALMNSDVGHAAFRIGDALTELIEAISAFEGEYTYATLVEQATLAALAAAGLDERPDTICMGYDRHALSSVPAELARWGGILDLMRDQLGECWPPDVRSA